MLSQDLLAGRANKFPIWNVLPIAGGEGCLDAREAWNVERVPVDIRSWRGNHELLSLGKT